ncbi:MAG: transcriptional regulator [Solirubrobacterales bacterium]|nr:transcriptional regulator [Solirubrobacterales bacterium]
MAQPGTPARRTQAERRATTRAALLDAAIACLVQDGYAGLTTRRVADRAGVSQGTQMHYFPTRALFVAEAIRHVATELTRELRSQLGEGPVAAEEQQIERLLDELWRVHTGPIFQATMELWVAARTDEEIRAAMDDVSRDVTRLIARSAAAYVPQTMAKPGAGDMLDHALATMRGLALLRFTGDAEDVARRWTRARRTLLALYDRLG